MHATLPIKPAASQTSVYQPEQPGLRFPQLPKVPRYVRFVDSFPMTVTGKIQKYLIRKRLRTELELTTERHA